MNEAVAGWGSLLHFALAGVSIVWILSSKKDSTLAVAWCLFVILLPFIGSILFFVIGYTGIRRSKQLTRLRASPYRSHRAAGQAPQRPATEDRDPWSDLAWLSTQLGAQPEVPGNRVDLYHEAEPAYAEMIQAIREARHHIHLEMFIYRSDESGYRFAEALAERARAGVHVRFLFDAVGSWRLQRRLLHQMRDAGISVVPFWSLLDPLRRRFQINHRNHRKLLVVDGGVGFTGGLNVGDEYLGKYAFFGPWRDSFLCMRGPGVLGLQRVFAEDWAFATGESLTDAAYFPNLPAMGGVPVQVAASEPDQEAQTIREIYLAALMRARKRVWIATPYFVPDAGLFDILCLTARSGRDVRLLCPFRPDKWLPFLAARYYWTDLLKSGCKIYQYTGGFLHAKVLLVDDEWTSLGTSNFDNRSLYLNFEVTCIMRSREIAADIERRFHTDFAQCILVNPEEFANRSFIARILENGCRLFSPVL